MSFAHPGWLWLIVLAPLPWLFDLARPVIDWPTLDGFRRRPWLSWTWLQALSPLARGIAVAAIAVALARPRTVGGVIHIAGRGVAIMVALDHSSSMNAVDYPTSLGLPPIARLEAAKETFARFVERRPDDLIGLVAFANYPDLVAPTTLDHGFLVEAGRAIRPARPGDDGTNIGDAVALALGALRASPPRKKVLVLLTDGNNEPAVPDPLDPLEAAALARDLGVTLHTIAIGSFRGPIPKLDPAAQPPLKESSGPNWNLLERMAELTGGRSFAAADLETLEKVFRTIDKLERSPIQGHILTRYNEHFAPWAGLAFGLLAFDVFLCQGRLRRLP